MSSELTVEVIEIKDLEPLPNSDFLELTHVYSYPVIVKKGDFKVGDKAIYFPVDACLPERDEFSFVWKGKENPTEKNRTIKAIKLRGTFSMGLCMPYATFFRVPSAGGQALSVQQPLPAVGDNVAERLGVKKYVPPEEVDLGGENEKTPGWLCRYTDIENIRKYHPILISGEEVVLTEKTHGSNGRYCWHEDRFWVGSHGRTKLLSGDDIWNEVAKKTGLADKCKLHPGLIFFGEVYGRIQARDRGMDYGIPKESLFVAFDVFSLERGKYLDYDEFTALVDLLQIPRVPELYRGPWTSFEEFEPMADGDSVLAQSRGGKHFREGFVLRPTKERFNDQVGRVILKLHGQEFLTAKRGKK